ncbi:MAG: hypothetical protein AABW48_02720 [Nanoarchaeota archaeon]
MTPEKQELKRASLTGLKSGPFCFSVRKKVYLSKEVYKIKTIVSVVTSIPFLIAALNCTNLPEENNSKLGYVTEKLETNSDVNTTSIAECQDTDAGKDRYTAGMITWTKNNDSERNEDVCLDDKILIEYYCRKNYAGTEYFNCENRCELGRCIPAVCGNGILEVKEECDDGNSELGDGCANCKFEIVAPYPGAADFDEPGYCRNFSEPGTYKVKPCDLFIGPFGIDYKIDEIDQYGQVHGDYIDQQGEVKFHELFSSSGIPVAHYGLKLLHVQEGTLKLTDMVDDLYNRCQEILYWSPASEPNNYCSIVSPTEAREGEAVFKTGRGYFGKTNYPKYSVLAECAAKDLQSTALNSAAFLGLPPLEPGLAFMYIFKDKVTHTGISFGSVSMWFYEYENQELINYEVEQCLQKLSSGIFINGDHELTHLLTRGFAMPLTFNEGLANFIPDQLNSNNPPKWDQLGSPCKEEGLVWGSSLLPYVKYYDDPGSIISYYSGNCFWQKLVHDYGLKILPIVMNVFKMHIGRGLSFEEQLLEAGIDISKYQQWGLGE